MKITAFCLLVFLQGFVFGQDPQALRHTTTESYKADFYVQLEDKKIKYNDTLFYHWFRAQKIHVTQGYASGNLLEGIFTSYFFSGQMMERGNFEAGLKTGEWKIWYESGQLKSILNYEHGILHGNFFRFDESGKVLESGSFKNGNYHGKIIENGEVKEYKNGSKKEQKPDDETVSESESKDKKGFLNRSREESEDEQTDEKEKKKFSFKNLFKNKSADKKEDKPEVKPEREKRKTNSNEVAEEKNK